MSSAKQDNKGKTAKGADFEKSLGELESIVERLETGDLSLEESLKAFESGVKLTRECRDALEKAEQKVSKLAGDDDEAGLEAFGDNDGAER